MYHCGAFLFYMEKIKAVYTTFSKQEVRYLKFLLEHFHGKKENKFLQLLSLIEKNAAISQEQASTILYGDPHSKAFIMLKKRLYERMKDTVIASVQEEDLSAKNREYLRTITMYKDLISAIVFQKRALYQPTYQLLKEVIEQSVEEGAHHIALITSSMMVNLVKDTKEFQEIETIFEEAYKKLRVTAKGRFGLAKINLIIGKTINEEAIREEISETIEDIENALEQSYSPSAHYNCLVLKAYAYELATDFAMLLKVSTEMEELFIKYPLLKSPIRRGYPIQLKAYAHLGLYDFSRAVAVVEDAHIQYAVPNKNYLMALHISVSAHIYQGDFEKAISIIEKNRELLIKHPNIYERIMYRSIIAHYLSGQVKKALQITQLPLDVLRTDKEGFNPTLRLTEIMLCLELEEEDLASTKLESGRKHFAKYKSTPREAIMYKILAAYEKKSFQWAVSFPAIEEMVKSLQELSWNPIANELFPYDDWIAWKINPLSPDLKEHYLLSIQSKASSM